MKSMWPAKNAGVALLMALAFIALASLLLISFVTMMRMERSTSESYSASLEAQEIGFGALDQIVTDLKVEIVDPGRSTEFLDPNGQGDPVYRPLDPEKILPQRVGAGNSASFDPNPNLVKVSRAAESFFDGTLAPQPTASAISTTSPSANGRKLGLSYWNKVRLLSDPATFIAPDWILVSRNGAKARTASELPTLKNVQDAGNEDAIVGRYAYAIYDVGGLLNINVAGYPSSASSLSHAKGASIWADLSQIPGLSNTAAFIAWRNETTQASAAAFRAHALDTWPKAGFRNPAPGDTTFVGRGDLLNYAAANPGIISETALPYLTTFSEDLNAASWGPSADAPSSKASYQYLSNSNADTAVNRFLPNVRVTTPFTRPDGTSANPGDTLLSKRFPLNRLGLISYAATGNTSSDLFKFFGLTRATASDPWVYSNADGSPANAIKNLKEIAEEGREANFFELLYACILNGSLGQYNLPPAYSYGNVSAMDSNPYYQALRIGANIIDQYDTDNYPTVISLSIDGTPATACKFYGIEDIPYPNKVLLKWVTARPITATNPSINWCTKFNAEIFFEMWNPHQELSTSNNAGPSEFRVVVNPATPAVPAMYSIKTRQISSGGQTVTHGGIATNPISGPIPASTAVKFNTTAGSYREPLVVRQDPALTPAGDASILSFPTGGSRALGFKMQGPAMPGPNFPGNLVNPNLLQGYWGYELTLTNVVFAFQQKDAFGNWQTYATSSGLEELPATGISKTGAEYVIVRTSPSWTKANNIAAFSSFIKSDPRTTRFGVSQGESDGATDFQADNPLISANGSVQKVLWGAPFYNKRLDLMAFNQPSTIAGYVPYKDADEVQRPGDNYLEDPLDWETSSSAKPPMKTGVTETRPIVLNRPFRTVGELGYVFRDMPWKTLDLFSTNSADTGLLDVFCIEDSPELVSGRVNLNTRNPAVLAALLTGVTTLEKTGATMDPTAATAIAQAIVSSSTDPAHGPVSDFGDFAARLAPTDSASPSKNKMEREAVMRALAGSTSTRSWNLLVDVVAQSGKYPPNATSLDKFVVEGERHYWMHVALDRYTGKVIAQSVETADE